MRAMRLSIDNERFAGEKAGDGSLSGAAWACAAPPRESFAFSRQLSTFPIDSVTSTVVVPGIVDSEKSVAYLYHVGLSGRGQDARGSRGSSAGARDFHDETWGQDVDWRFVWTTSRTLSRGRGLRVCGRHRRACYVAFSLA